MRKLLDVLKLLGTAFGLIAVVGVASYFTRKNNTPPPPPPFEPAERIAFTALEGGAVPGNNHLVISGGILNGARIVEKAIRDEEHGKIVERRSYLPFVHDGWAPTQPVKLVFSAKAWAGYRLEGLVRAPERKGLLYDAPWDDMSNVRDEFDKMGVHLDPRARLVVEPEGAE